MTPEHELGCPLAHPAVLKDGRAWCDVCGVFVSPQRTGRVRVRQFVSYPTAERFR